MPRLARGLALLVANTLLTSVYAQDISTVYHDWYFTLTDRLTTDEDNVRFGREAPLAAETFVPWMLEDAPGKSHLTQDWFRYRHSVAMIGGVGPAAAEAAPTLIDLIRADNPPETRRKAAAALLAVDPNREISRYVFLKLLGDEDSELQRIAEEETAQRIDIPADTAPVEVDERFSARIAAALRSSDPRRRFEGAWAMRLRPYSALRDQAAVSLAQLLGHRDSALRFAAAAALEKLPFTETLEALRLLLKDESRLVRAAAWRALGAAGESAALILKNCAANADTDVRYGCTQALRAAGPRITSAVPVLAALTRDEDAHIRAAALNALYRIGTDEAFEALVDLLDTPEPSRRSWDFPEDEIARSALFLLEQAQQAALPTLIKGFNGSRVPVRRYVALIFSRIADEREVRLLHDPLLKGLTDSHPAIRRHCLTAMHRQGMSIPETNLNAALSEGDYLTRQMATRILREAHVRKEFAEAAIARAIRDPAYGDLAEALHAAVRRDPQVVDVLPLIVDLLNHEKGVVREAAGNAVASLAKSDDALGLLLPLAEDPSNRALATTLRALGRFKQHADRVVPILAQAVNDDNYSVRMAAIQSLAGFRSAAKGAVPELIAAAGKGYWVAHTLGEIGDARAIPVLVALLKGTQAQAAAEALNKMRASTPEAVEGLADLYGRAQDYRTRSAAANALLQAGLPGMRRLGHILLQGDEEMRKVTASLVVSASADSFPVLIEMVAAESSDDRSIAYHAIVQIGRPAQGLVTPLQGLAATHARKEVRETAMAAISAIESAGSR